MKAREEALTFTTISDGSFTGIVPAGAVTVTLDETTVKATVQPGEVSRVDLLIHLKGIVLTVLSPTGMPADAWVTAAYQSPTGDHPGIAGSKLAPGCFWFPGIPATTTAFAALIYQSQGENNYPTRAVWHFDDVKSDRDLTFTLETLFPVSLQLVDPQGIPAANVPVWGNLTAEGHALTYWDDEQKTNELPQVIDLRDLQTDRAGMVTLGLVPARKYTMVLGAGDSVGERVALDVHEDGTISLERYTLLRQMRARVVQTVFGADGKPAPHAELTASYCWRGKVTLRSAAADETGRVIWSDIPPVRALIWGKGVPVGVLPSTGNSVNTPLPAPVPQSKCTYRFQIINFGDVPVDLNWMVTGSASGRTQAALQPIHQADGLLARFDRPCQSGEQLELIVEAKTKPTRSAFMKGLYLPYLDVEGIAVFPITLEDDIPLTDDVSPEAPEDAGHGG